VCVRDRESVCSVSERMLEYVCVCVCVCVRERERYHVCECVQNYVWKREKEIMCVLERECKSNWVCVREREIVGVR